MFQAGIRTTFFVFTLLNALPLLAQEGTNDATPPKSDATAQSDSELDLNLDSLGGEVKEAEVKTLAPPEPVPTTVRSLTLPSWRFPKAMTGQLLIDHRARQKFYDYAFRDGLGLDAGGLKIGLGLRFVPLSFLEAHVERMNGVFDTYEFGLRWRILNAESVGISLLLGGSVSWFMQPNAQDAAGYNGELILGRSLPFGVDISLMALAASDSSSLSKRGSDPNHSVGVGAALDWRIPGADFVQLSAETLFSVAGYDGGHPLFSAGVTFLTWRHAFSILVSNSQLFTADALPAGSDRALDDLILGFHILRQFGDN